MKDITLFIRRLVESNGKWITFGCIKLKSFEFKFLFLFKIREYFISLLLLISFFVFYWSDIKLYSKLKLDIAEFIGLNLVYILFFLLLILIFFVILIIILNIKKNKVLKQQVYCFIYHKLVYIINYLIFTTVLNIDLSSYLEYNIIGLFVLIIYFIIKTLNRIFKRKMEFTLIHFLTIPYLVILWWIWLFIRVVDKKVFLELYGDFCELVGNDEKFYIVVCELL